MTRNEAIENLKEFIDTYITCHGEEDTVAVSIDNVDVEALDMAIEALEQLTSYEQTINKLTKAISEQEPCEDAISRKAVRHILNHEVKMPIKVWKKLFNLVDDLPSVNPQEKTGHWIWRTEDIYRCSECGNDIRVKEVMNVPQYVCCPMCEARMIKPQESEG